MPCTPCSSNCTPGGCEPGTLLGLAHPWNTLHKFAHPCAMQSDRRSCQGLHALLAHSCNALQGLLAPIQSIQQVNLVLHTRLHTRAMLCTDLHTCRTREGPDPLSPPPQDHAILLLLLFPSCPGSARYVASLPPPPPPRIRLRSQHRSSSSSSSSPVGGKAPSQNPPSPSLNPYFPREGYVTPPEGEQPPVEAGCLSAEQPLQVYSRVTPPPLPRLLDTYYLLTTTPTT